MFCRTECKGFLFPKIQNVHYVRTLQMSNGIELRCWQVRKLKEKVIYYTVQVPNVSLAGSLRRCIADSSVSGALKRPTTVIQPCRGFPVSWNRQQPGNFQKCKNPTTREQVAF